ncbi:MAG: tetratricopeptide repeat protein [Candidatus Euphemobacter frigidus]|nr:tetratricopeptide repeat protein [Candidatus Euphemobacter frigidus]MDP8274960.1 tetratricopeptide repeat protein [Candidatus Euphemobacter frigidus]
MKLKTKIAIFKVIFILLFFLSAVQIITFNTLAEVEKTAEYYYRVAKKCLVHKQTYKAIEAYKEAIKLKPDDYDLYLELGTTYKNAHLAELTGKAIEPLMKAINLRPSDYRAYKSLGGAYFNLGQYNEAAQMYAKAIELNPKESGVYLMLGSAYSKDGQYQKAIEIYRKGLKVNPSNFIACQIHIRMAEAYLSLNDREAALREYKILKDLDQEQANSLLKIISIWDGYKK